jgi:hypothetical protein
VREAFEGRIFFRSSEKSVYGLACKSVKPAEGAAQEVRIRGKRKRMIARRAPIPPTFDASHGFRYDVFSAGG